MFCLRSDSSGSLSIGAHCPAILRGGKRGVGWGGGGCWEGGREGGREGERERERERESIRVVSSLSLSLSLSLDHPSTAADVGLVMESAQQMSILDRH